MLQLDVTKNIKSAVKGNSSLCIKTTLKDGVITGVYGNSGEGKSTLLNMVAGLISPTAGTISFNDTTWFDSKKKIWLSTQNRNIGYIFQENSLFPHFTVKQNILYAVNDKKEVDIPDLLEKVDMANMGDRYPHQLSGGQIQRVAIARALAQKAQLILMDEPFSALDLEIKQRLFKLIKAFKEQYGLMILMVTHDINDVFYLCDDVLWLKEHNGQKVMTKNAFKKEIETKYKFT